MNYISCYDANGNLYDKIAIRYLYNKKTTGIVKFIILLLRTIRPLQSSRVHLLASVLPLFPRERLYRI